MITNTQKETYYQKNRDELLQKSKDYYENNKEQRKEYRKNKYNNMTNEEKLKVLEYQNKWYHTLDLERKRKMSEYIIRLKLIKYLFMIYVIYLKAMHSM